MKSLKILLAEDDINLGALLRNYLNAKGFDAILFNNSKEALKEYKTGEFGLCILDIMMPEMDGLTLAREIKNLTPDIPVIFLTARSQKEDILDGFRGGADDYITKPFSMEELVFRIEAIMKRVTSSRPEKKEGPFKLGKYEFDPHKQILAFEGESVKLTTKESELMELLCTHGNDILERNFALKSIWIDDNYFNARSMDVYITRLRKYLKKDPSLKILNVHGKGYKMIC